MSRSLLFARERSDNMGEKLGRGIDVGEVGEGSVASHEFVRTSVHDRVF